MDEDFGGKVFANGPVNFNKGIAVAERIFVAVLVETSSVECSVRSRSLLS